MQSPRWQSPKILVQPPLVLLALATGATGYDWSVEKSWSATVDLLLTAVLLSVSYLVLLEPLRRHRIWREERLSWRLGLALAFLSAAIPILDIVLLGAIGTWRTEPFGTWLRSLATGGMPIGLFLPAVLITGAGLVELSLDADARARKLSLRSERMLVGEREARLKLLRLQLHPHFLFNALNSVSALLIADRARAAEMVGRLQSLYGRSLRSLERPLVPLSEELDWCREYLAIERQRFSDRLRVDIRVEPDAAAAAVPPLLLQPLVENAVRHGVAREPGAAWIQIEAFVDEDGALRVRVANGARAGGRMNEGFGLRHTRRRLAEAFGGQASLDIARSGEVVAATLRLPHVGAPAPVTHSAADGHT
jgi:hypothetical protein